MAHDERGEIKMWQHHIDEMKLVDYILHQLPPSESKRIAAHLEQCPSCWKSYNSWSYLLQGEQGATQVPSRQNYFYRIFSLFTGRRRWSKGRTITAISSIMIAGL